MKLRSLKLNYIPIAYANFVISQIGERILSLKSEQGWISPPGGKERAALQGDKLHATVFIIGTRVHTLNTKLEEASWVPEPPSQPADTLFGVPIL
jgi:hypothetical protein